jgi:hypothetical protein
LAGFEGLSRKRVLAIVVLARGQGIESCKPATRACLGQVSGGMAMSTGEKPARKIGLKRTEAWWGIKNLTFNIIRYFQLFHHVRIMAGISPRNALRSS